MAKNPSHKTHSKVISNLFHRKFKRHPKLWAHNTYLHLYKKPAEVRLNSLKQVKMYDLQTLCVHNQDTKTHCRSKARVRGWETFPINNEIFKLCHDRYVVNTSCSGFSAEQDWLLCSFVSLCLVIKKYDNILFPGSPGTNVQDRREVDSEPNLPWTIQLISHAMQRSVDVSNHFG